MAKMDDVAFHVFVHHVSDTSPPPPVPESVADWMCKELRVKNDTYSRGVSNRISITHPPYRPIMVDIPRRRAVTTPNVTVDQLRRQLTRDQGKLDHYDRRVEEADDNLRSLREQRGHLAKSIDDTQRLIQAFEDAERVVELENEVARLKRRLGERDQ